MEANAAQQTIGIDLDTLRQQAAQVRELAQRDREVRAHEQAHAAVGGAHASHPHYDLQKGPNGVSYAVSGHVNIDVSEVAGDPQATLEKMQIVQRAALAPANPSAADRAVAAKAAQSAAQARVELARERNEQTDDALVARTNREGNINISDAEGTKGSVIDVML